MKKFLPLTYCVILASCASGPKVISYEDASSFERSLLARKVIMPEEPKKLYTQPVNKKEACKILSSQDQLERSNFRAYWDGECKNGFAFGLGRDIAISDTHHVEEITIYDGSGDNWQQPSVGYDYINNMVLYTISDSVFPATTRFTEKIDNTAHGFNAYHTLSVVDKLGKAFVIQSSAFNPQRIYLNTKVDQSIGYRFTDYSALPLVNQSAPIFTTEIIDPKNNISGDVAIARYANGSVKHFKMSNGIFEPVLLSANYTNHLSEKYQEVINATSRANFSLQRAQQIEREYLFKACNGHSGIDNLDTRTYTKICTWRDQFKAPYAIASENYQKQLEGMRVQAATAEQQRQIQQQIVLQQQMLQQQQSIQIWNAVNQASREFQQNTQKIMQGVNSWQAPQVQPTAPLGGNKVVCHTIGSITTCR